MKKRMLSWFFRSMVCFLLSPALSAQTVLLFQDVENEYRDEYGPNRRYFNSSHTDYGMHFGLTDSSGSDINFYKSGYIAMGWRHKRELAKFFAVGHDFAFNFRNYSIRQHADKVFGGFQNHLSEKVWMVNAHLTLFMRFNFLPNRGDHLGKYLDLGGFVEYGLMRRHVIKDEVDPINGFTSGKYSLRKLQYIDPLQFGLSARLGVSIFSVFFHYRLTQLTEETGNLNFPDLPRYTAGISFDVELSRR